MHRKIKQLDAKAGSGSGAGDTGGPEGEPPKPEEAEKVPGRERGGGRGKGKGKGRGKATAKPKPRARGGGSKDGSQESAPPSWHRQHVAAYLNTSTLSDIRKSKSSVALEEAGFRLLGVGCEAAELWSLLSSFEERLLKLA